jgi:hypothetical protein
VRNLFSVEQQATPAFNIKTLPPTLINDATGVKSVLIIALKNDGYFELE